MTPIKSAQLRLALLSIVLCLFPSLSCMDNSVNFTPAPGTTWEIRAEDIAESLEDVIWTGSQYVAVGWHKILTSPDGYNWQLRHTYNAGKLYGICWTGEMFWVVGDSVVLRSDDAVAWSQAPISSSLRDVAASGDMVVAVGEDGDLWITSDGATWTETAMGFGCRAVSPNLAGDHIDAIYRFAAGGEDFRSRATINGISWDVPLTAEATNRYINDLILLSNFAWAVGDAGVICINGRVYPTGELTGRPLRAIAWGGNTAVVVGDVGTIILATVNSTTFNWESAAVQFSPTTLRLNGVCFNGVGYLAVGQSGIVIGSPCRKDR